jgi:ring-1,2-phenylacetyl-CoA epoxidase subunit PaaC
VSERAQALLEYADDELILGWRDSEWTGIAPFLEEDVAFSSIAQNEVGHARALYELAAAEMGTTADDLAFDRRPEEYRSSPFVEARHLDWAGTIARHVLYEAADEIRLEALKASDDEAVAGLAAKMDREEAYHRLHAQMWEERLRGEPRFQAALDELWPAAVALLPEALRPKLADGMNQQLPSNNLLLGYERGSHSDDWTALWEEMTEVRRSVPGAAW